MKTFSLEKLRADALAWVSAPGRSRCQLARESKIDWKCLNRFLAHGRGLSGKTIEKLWAIVYDGQPSQEESSEAPWKMQIQAQSPTADE